jgi:hypothetical protein
VPLLVINVARVVDGWKLFHVSAVLALANGLTWAIQKGRGLELLFIKFVRLTWSYRLSRQPIITQEIAMASELANLARGAIY